jgi:hypothetical protein
MEVKQFQAMAVAFGLEEIGRRHEFNSTETELGVFTGAIGPLAGSFAEQAASDAKVGFYAELTGDGKDLVEFLEFLNHEDDVPANLSAHKGHSNEGWVLIAVADDERTVLTL